MNFTIKYCVGAISCFYAFSFGIIFSKNRFFISEICNIFGFNLKFVFPIIPQIKSTELISDEVPIHIRKFLYNDGDVSITELIVIAKIVSHFSPQRIFEIGTFNGRTTLNIAANSGKNSIIYTIDLPKSMLNSTAMNIDPVEKKYIDKESSGSFFKNSNCEDKIVQLYGDSANFDFTPFYNSIDFVFIDGSHSYDYAKSDSEIAFKLLKDGKGIILWHDYDTVWDGVTIALNEIFKTKAEFCNLRHLENTSLVYLNLG